MKKLFFALLLGAFCLPAIAQPEFSGKAEFVSRNIWRGTDNSSSAAINPEFNLNWGGFNVYTWATQAFDNSYNEVDLGVSYTLGAFTLGLADYFYPLAQPGMKDGLFAWDKGDGFHQVDATLTFEPENLPIWATWSTIVGGEDFNADDNRAFSSYLEVGYKKEFGEDNVVSAFLGASVLKGMYTGYDQDFSVVNVGISYEKTFSFNKVSFPLSVSYIVNPYLEKSYMVFGAAIEF